MFSAVYKQFARKFEQSPRASDQTCSFRIKQTLCRDKLVNQRIVTLGKLINQMEWIVHPCHSGCTIYFLYRGQRRVRQISEKRVRKFARRFGRNPDRFPTTRSFRTRGINNYVNESGEYLSSLFTRFALFVADVRLVKSPSRGLRASSTLGICQPSLIKALVFTYSSASRRIIFNRVLCRGLPKLLSRVYSPTPLLRK